MSLFSEPQCHVHLAILSHRIEKGQKENSAMSDGALCALTQARHKIEVYLVKIS